MPDLEAGQLTCQRTRETAGGMAHRAKQIDGRMVMLTPREAPNGFAYTERVTFDPQGPDAYRWTQEIVYSETTSVVMGEVACRRR